LSHIGPCGHRRAAARRSLFGRVHWRCSPAHRRALQSAYLECNQDTLIRNVTTSPQANRILAGVSPKTSRSFLAGLKRVELRLGRVLCEARTAHDQVYFPNDCMISLLAMAERGGGLEVGLVGSEGMVGVAAALGAATSPVKALVQGAGSAMRTSAAQLRRELKRNPSLQRTVDRCAYVAMATAMQIAVCNKEHLLEARLARWLLMTQDRVGSDRFRFTQHFIALMLGVRRAGVNAAAGALQRRGLIRYSRGSMQVLDRKGLLASACSCYQVIRQLEQH
jgi:CRP-like cAMP-binding protein